MKDGKYIQETIEAFLNIDSVSGKDTLRAQYKILKKYPEKESV